MKITNRFHLPEAIHRAAATDEYSRGDSRLSVTQLIGPPQISILRDRHAGDMETDVVDRIWSLLGTAVHKLLDKGADASHVTEERLFTEVRGWVISGAIDVQHSTGIIDYKVTSVFSVQSDKPEWETQLNCYAALIRRVKGTLVKKLEICAVLRDWSRMEASYTRAYPQAPIVLVNIPVWSPEKQDAYLEERVKLHQDAATAAEFGEALPECTKEERWVRDEKWAVMKVGATRASKLVDTEAEATTIVGTDPSKFVEHRLGRNVRCEGNYCGVAAWCRQFNVLKQDTL